MKIDLNKINRKQLLIAVLILVRLIFIYFATKYEATYLKKDSNHYLLLSESIKDYFFNDDLEESKDSFVSVSRNLLKKGL